MNQLFKKKKLHLHKPHIPIYALSRVCYMMKHNYATFIQAQRETHKKFINIHPDQIQHMHLPLCVHLLLDIVTFSFFFFGQPADFV